MTWQLSALLGAFFAGLTAVLARVGIKGVDSNLATAVRTVVIVLFAWGIVLAQGTWKTLPALSGRTLLFLVLSGFATGLSWLFYFRAVQLTTEVSRAASIDKLSLVFTIVLAALFLGEKPPLQVWAGVALIVAGTLLLVK